MTTSKYTLPVEYSKLEWWEKKEVREQYIKQQKGLCSFCKEPLSKPSAKYSKKKVNKKLFPSSFFKHPVHLHHDHYTDLTIGAVHCKCNAILWQYYGE